MDKESIKGSLEKLGGKIKETVGDLTNNESLKNEGKLDQVTGSAHEALGSAKDAGRDAVDKVKKLVE